MAVIIIPYRKIIVEHKTKKSKERHKTAINKKLKTTMLMI